MQSRNRCIVSLQFDLVGDVKFPNVSFQFLAKLMILFANESVQNATNFRGIEGQRPIEAASILRDYQGYIRFSNGQ